MKLKLLIFIFLVCMFSLTAEAADFPNNFVSGVLNWGVDCENIKFNKDFTFEYKFSGDCKGWGRVLKGEWKKGDGKLLLSAKMSEGPSEENGECSGSYYETYSKAKKKTCINKYKKRIVNAFGVYPAHFKISGFVVLNEKSEAIVTLQSELINNEKSKSKTGFLNIEGDSFGIFGDL
ncbi:hypothetical protein V6Z05_20020 [Leptospira venezuelensis]|uniref:hypothetical protein n=1 Tax=Leptospira venezuelensis TaxID=1958811 RepID=UPI000A3A9D55|nr:hypothetical protein [Leptospira venezuelensis]